MSFQLQQDSYGQCISRKIIWSKLKYVLLEILLYKSRLLWQGTSHRVYSNNIWKFRRCLVDNLPHSTCCLSDISLYWRSSGRIHKQPRHHDQLSPTRGAPRSHVLPGLSHCTGLCVGRCWSRLVLRPVHLLCPRPSSVVAVIRDHGLERPGHARSGVLSTNRQG